MSFAAVLVIIAAVLIFDPVNAAPPAFLATIDITGNLEISVGEVATLTAVWNTNRDLS